LSKWWAECVLVGMEKDGNGRAPLSPAEASKREADAGAGGGDHEVFIPMTMIGGEGRWRGARPASNVSMMTMRLPQ
jgi:hypothetical protein